jgi:hypothetical protein
LAFYPISYQRAYLLLKQGFDLAHFVDGRTYAIHLWNQGMRDHLAKVERGSPIDRLLTQGFLL